jgi:hypothetical protein
MNVMRKAANRPMGYVGSAVMLNARLKPGVNLMHVVAMTRRWASAAVARKRNPRFTAGPTAPARM